jgi:hypothetical protein
VLSRRDVLRFGALCLVGPSVLGGCALSNPAVDDPNASSSLTPSSTPAATSAGPTPSASPTVPGAPVAAAAELQLAALATAILGGPHHKTVGGRQRTLLHFVAATHTSHAAALAPRSPAQPLPKIGQLSLQQSLALLARREAAAGTAYGRSALSSRGRDALMWGSWSVASASIASVVTAAKPPGVTPVHAHRPAALLSDVEAVQQLVAQLHAVVYGYQLALGHLPVLGRPHARAVQELLETRLRRDRLIAWLQRRSATVPVAEPAYVPSTVPGGAASSAKLIRQLQVALQPFCGLWLAAAGSRADRQTALATLRSVQGTARGWGAPLTAWPGWS